MKLIIYLLVFITSAVTEARFQNFSLPIDNEYNTSLSNIIGPNPLSLDSLKKDQHLYSNYEEFLDYLYERAPEIFNNPVLLHHTGSIQRASLEYPRVLLFGKGSVISFADERGVPVPRVEMIEFDPQTGRFQMGEIRFKEINHIEFEVNPRKCLSCHGDDPNPIWSSYDLWPKAFGAKASFFASNEEYHAYSQLSRRPNKHGIYKKINLKAKLRTDRMSALEDFTQYLFTLNTIRMMSVLKKNKHILDTFKYAFLATLNGCTGEAQRRSNVSLDELIPSHIMQAFSISSNSLNADSLNSRVKLKEYLKTTYQSFFPNTEPDFSATDRLDFETKIIADSRFILENLGIPWRELTMNHGVNDYSMQTPSNMPFEFGKLITFFDPVLLPELSPEIENVFGLDLVVLDCNVLKEKSLKALNSLTNVPTNPVFTTHEQATTGLAPISRCIKCHAVEKTAPFIPFDDAMKLGQWLNQGSNKDILFQKVETNSMPRGSSLSTDQKEAIYEVMNILYEY